MLSKNTRLTLSEGLTYQDLTGRSFERLPEVINFFRLERVSSALKALPAETVHQVLSEGAVAEEDEWGELANLLQSYIKSAHYNLTKHLDDPDTVDYDEVRARALAQIETDKCGVDWEEYKRCMSSYLWILEHHRTQSGLSYDDFMAREYLDDIIGRLGELIDADSSEPLEGSASDGGDSPLAVPV